MLSFNVRIEQEFEFEESLLAQDDDINHEKRKQASK